MWWNYTLSKVKTIFVRVFLFRHLFMTNPTIFWTLLRFNEYDFFNILWFSCQGKSRDIVYQRTCWFSWLIFVQHWLYGILLTAWSALSRLTDQGIIYLTRCRIWLLTLFHIAYINFKRELRKVTPQKLYLSFFFVQYISVLKQLFRRFSPSYDLKFCSTNSFNSFKSCQRKSNFNQTMHLTVT